MFSFNIKIKKIIFTVIIFLLFVTSTIFAQSSANTNFKNTNPVPAKTAQPGNKKKIQNENNLNEKIFDFSVVSGITYNSYQNVLSFSLQGCIFVTPLLNLGIKVSRELFYTYDNVFDFDFVLRLYFLSKGAILPFFHVEGGYAIGKKLSGFAVRPGFGVLYYIYKHFSLHLGALFDLWYFTYRHNADTAITYKNVKIDEINLDIRIVFGFSFLFNK